MIQQILDARCLREKNGWKYWIHAYSDVQDQITFSDYRNVKAILSGEVRASADYVVINPTTLWFKGIIFEYNKRYSEFRLKL